MIKKVTGYIVILALMSSIAAASNSSDSSVSGAQTQSQSSESNSRKEAEEEILKALQEESESSSNATVSTKVVPYNENIEIRKEKKEVNYQAMSPQRLKKIVKEGEKKLDIWTMEHGLVVGGKYIGYLNHTNYFYYQQNLPLLFVFPKDIFKVVLFGERVKSMYYKRSLIYFPPSQIEGSLNGFVVIFTDGSSSYFLGKRVDPLLWKDKHIPVITYYKYILKRRLDTQEIVQAFLQEYHRCPSDGDVVSVDGYHYKFSLVKGSDKIMVSSNEVYMCKHIFRIYSY